MKSQHFSAKPRLVALLSVLILLIIGLVVSYSRVATIEVIKPAKVESHVVPTKLYNEDLFDWFNITFLPQTLDDGALMELLDNHTVTEDSRYQPDSKKSVYDVIGPLIATNGGIGEHRYYIAKEDGIKGSSVYADEFLPNNTLIGVYTGVRTHQSDDTKYEWNYYSRPLFEGEPLPIGLDAMYGGNMLRFINDGKLENINVDAVSIPWENRWFRLYFASRDIHPGQELLVSYGSGYWQERDFAP
jgi:hypothetical protein